MWAGWRVPHDWRPMRPPPVLREGRVTFSPISTGAGDGMPSAFSTLKRELEYERRENARLVKCNEHLRQELTRMESAYAKRMRDARQPGGKMKRTPQHMLFVPVQMSSSNAAESSIYEPVMTFHAESAESRREREKAERQANSHSGDTARAECSDTPPAVGRSQADCRRAKSGAPAR